MLMDSFEVENFRSLKHLKLEKLARVNVLVGKNNSGKTSVLEGLYALTCIETPNWFDELENNRSTGDKQDPRYLFYRFDVNNIIKLESIYSGSLPKSLFPASMIARVKMSDKIYRKEGEQLIESKLSGGRRVESPAGLIIDIQTPDNSEVVSFEVVRPSRAPNYLKPISKNAAKFISEHTDTPPIERHIVNLIYTTFDENLLSVQLEDLKVNKQDSRLLEVLKLIDNRIKSIDLGSGGQIYLDLGDDFRTLSPLGLLGDGVQRLLAIVAAIVADAGGIIFIDEIDNGLHYSALRILWKGILQAAREYDVQVFATTHSAEALRHLTWVLDEEENASYRDDVAAYTLIRADDDTVRSYRHDYEQLDYALDHGLEIRN